MEPGGRAETRCLQSIAAFLEFHSSVFQDSDHLGGDASNDGNLTDILFLNGQLRRRFLHPLGRRHLCGLAAERGSHKILG